MLSACFFAPAVMFFTAALVLLPFVARDAATYFYQAHVLAVTHMLTLGWISMAILGVLYRYVPRLTKRALPYPRVAIVQCASFVVGVAGLVVHFWLGRWTATACAAGLLFLAASLACVNFWPLLLGAPGRGVAEVGILASTALFAGAAAFGTLLAADKQYPLLGGSTLTNLGAHAHLAALGWVGVTVSAMSLRFLPAFLLPTVDVSRAALRQVTTLAGAVVLLATALLARRLVGPAAVLVVGALVAHVVLVVRVAATHRMPIDWTARHALAGVAWLAAAATAGLTLIALGVQAEAGARVAAAYGVAGILGWMSNLLIGVSYKLFPAFVAAARSERGRGLVPIESLSVPAALHGPIFVVFNAGVGGVAAGALLGVGPVVLGGSLALAVSGVLYGSATARTLAFLLVDPRRAPALSVVP